MGLATRQAVHCWLACVFVDCCGSLRFFTALIAPHRASRHHIVQQLLVSPSHLTVALCGWVWLVV